MTKEEIQRVVSLLQTGHKALVYNQVDFAKFLERNGEWYYLHHGVETPLASLPKRHLTFYKKVDF